MRRTALAICLLGVIVGSLLSAALASAAAPPKPEQDPFYSYDGSAPLRTIPPGTVLKTRTLAYHVAGLPLPVRAVQLLYRTTGQTGRPEVNVTSVLEPPLGTNRSQVVAYQSFYDSLNPDDEPSYAIAGGLTPGGMIPHFEAGLFASELAAGRPVVVDDTEGQTADFSDGPEYGINTLDGIRAALSSPAAAIPAAAKVGMLGYSGGAIATEWAAELAPSYAPDVDRRLVGAAFGGVLADPVHNLHYIDGSLEWAGVMPMGLIGIARAFHVDMRPYMSAYGKQLFEKLQRASISEALGHYPGLTWKQLAKPRYPTPESIPVFVKIANRLIMGAHGTPTVPLMIAQGERGEVEGSQGTKPGIGPGDGVMIAGDVRTLAREYCDRGLAVQYSEYELDHIGTAAPWEAAAIPWLSERFAGAPAPQNCASIPPGNPLTPIRRTQQERFAR
jgi:hypothetical protein